MHLKANMRNFLKGSIVFLLTVLPLGYQVQAQPIKAVVTYSILGDIVKNVAGDKVDLTVLVGPNGDVHTFEPTPKESISLARADIIFENGLYLEHWLDSLYEASGSKAKRILSTDGIDPISILTHKEIIINENPKDVDPHVWHDVSNVMIMTERVRDGLISVDPANTNFYKENTEKYLAELAKLDHWIIDTLKDIPDEKRKFVTSHNTLGYFAKRYGFQIIGTALPSATTEAEDSSAADMAKLVDLIKSSGVKVLFTENTHNPKLVEALSKEAKAMVAPVLYTDALGAPGSPGESYIKMMQYNVKIFADYLK
jgi:zinc/manganese transport system substrate-binding protein